MKNLYLLSGLGADKRVFDFLELDHYQVTHVTWINPINQESIESYAARLLPQITTVRPILIGVSFGGIMAIEIAKLIETEKVILISSVKTKFELPFQLRIAGKLGLMKSIPKDFSTKANWLTFFLFGVSKPNEKEMLMAILRDTDIDFLKWGLKTMAQLQNEFIPPNTSLIHGTRDRIFPMKNPDYIIDKGGHLMIVNRSEEISKLLREIIDGN